MLGCLLHSVLFLKTIFDWLIAATSIPFSNENHACSIDGSYQGGTGLYYFQVAFLD